MPEEVQELPIIQPQPLPTSIIMNVVPGTLTERTADGPVTQVVKWVHIVISMPTGHTEIFLQPNDALDVVRQLKHQIRVARSGLVLPEGVFLPDNDGFNPDSGESDAGPEE